MGSSDRIRFKITIALFVSAIIVLSCKDKTIKESAIEDDKNVSALTITDLVINYTENGIIRTKVTTPLGEQYSFADEPYRVFPKGIHLYSFTADSVLESEIVADYALNRETPEDLWQAFGNVVVTNYLKQQVLTTDTLYWNSTKKIIYTDAPAHIKTPDAETYARNGLTADDRFENYEIRSAYNGHFIYDTNQKTDSANTAENSVKPVVNQ